MSLPSTFTPQNLFRLKQKDDDFTPKNLMENLIKLQEKDTEDKINHVTCLVKKGIERENNRGYKYYSVEYEYIKHDWLAYHFCINEYNDKTKNTQKCKHLSLVYDGIITRVINTEFVQKRGFDFRDGRVHW